MDFWVSFPTGVLTKDILAHDMKRGRDIKGGENAINTAGVSAGAVLASPHTARYVIMEASEKNEEAPTWRGNLVLFQRLQTRQLKRDIEKSLPENSMSNEKR